VVEMEFTDERLLAAEQDLRRATELSRKAFRRNDPEYCVIALRLERTLYRQQKYQEGEKVCRQLQADLADKNATGVNNRLLAIVNDNLGMNLLAQGRAEEAAELFQRSYDDSVALHGEPIDIASPLKHLAQASRALGRESEADKALQKLLETDHEFFGDDHVETITALKMLAEVAQQRRQFTQAAKFLQRAYAAATSLWGAADQRTMEIKAALDRCVRSSSTPPASTRQTILQK
jgi:tetratricopeptide (TPR) repeat protein